MKRKVLLKILKILRACLIFGLVFIIIMPYVKIFVDSIKSYADRNNNLVVWVVTNPQFSNITNAFKRLVNNKSYFNTITLSLFTSILQVIAASMAGYAFAKLKFRGSNILFWIIMFSIIVPKQSLYTSRVLLFSSTDFFGINLFKSFLSIYLMTIFGMGIYSAFFIYLYRQQFRLINNELVEQASIDGAGPLKTYYKVMLPSASGATIVTFLMTFILTYNDYYYPNFYKFPSNGRLYIAVNMINNRYGNSSLTALCMIVPLLILYMIVQKVFLDSIEKIVIV